MHCMTDLPYSKSRVSSRMGTCVKMGILHLANDQCIVSEAVAHNSSLAHLDACAVSVCGPLPAGARGGRDRGRVATRVVHRHEGKHNPVNRKR